MVPEARKKSGKSGPPPRGPFEDKHSALSTRITKKTRKRLDHATAVSGRSLSQEIELRLEQSFRDEDAVGGAETSALLKLMAAGAIIVQQRTGKSWTEDWDTFVAVQQCWKKLLVATAFPGLPKEVRTAWEAELPDPPESPQRPKPHGVVPGSGLLLAASPPLSDKERQAYEKKWVAYDKAEVRYRRRFQAVSERIKEFVGLGEEVADLFPKRTKTKG